MAEALTLNGLGFSQILRAGALAVVREQEVLDRINVFPVRDADTGANLAATLKSAAARLGSRRFADIGRAARAAAEGALDGARGNSGAIVAQFLHGLARGVESRDEVGAAQFAAAAQLGMESAYAALARPREGTILSVLRAWSDELVRRAVDEDLGHMLRGGLEAARRALSETPRQLDVLARHGVVDAGGQGWVFFLEGAHEALRGDEVLWQPVEAPPRGLPVVAAGHDLDDAYRFCTEALVVARGERRLSPAEVREAVERFGESLVVAGGDRRMRIHLHTNEPQRFLAAVAELGAIERSKVDDMVLQQLQGRTSAIAIVTDSTIDLPESLAFRLGVVAVPLTLTLGDQEYLDGVDITLDEYVRRIAAGTAVPRSSQPAVADFVQTYRRLLDYREGIVSVHVAGATSGTVEAARAAAREVDPRRVRVVDACAVSVAAGLVVEAVGEAIAAGADLDEVVAAGERARRDTRLYGTVASLDFAVRGGRVSPVLATTLRRLRLAPIIVFDETGKPGKGGAALGFDRALKTIVRRTVRFAGDGGGRAMVAHSGDRAAAEFVAGRLHEKLGGDVPIVVASAVLTTHVGIGAVAAAVRLSRPA